MSDACPQYRENRGGVSNAAEWCAIAGNIKPLCTDGTYENCPTYISYRTANEQGKRLQQSISGKEKRPYFVQ